MVTATFWKDRSVLVTGHTGFKGSWLSLWLHNMGAAVHGYALDPNTTPSHFNAADLSETLASDTRANIGDYAQLANSLQAAQPEIVLHLAAQPLVRESYTNPVGTFADNVLGTIHVLEAVRQTPSVQAVVVITTDKVYDNKEWLYPYRESDNLGGHDPYSASKAAAEIATASYRKSFFGPGKHPARIATARAGNVIGGGDWATDRLVPDCLTAFSKQEPVQLRFPNAVRPWQHVLEPLAGYLMLAERLVESTCTDDAQAWNFGPNAEDDVAVGEVAKQLAKYWGNGAEVILSPDKTAPHEAGLLRLDSSKARALLNWTPQWTVDEALQRTVEWHRGWLSGQNVRSLSLSQINDYVQAPTART